MIPLRLHMRNFLSYAEPEPIDFTSFDVACLAGDNGVGKSALLDAMTWAVFGSARGCESGQNQERLIRDGADEAFVEFTFELNGTTYQATRIRKRPKGKERAARGNEVRFLVQTPDGWTNLAKESIRETDAYIESVVRMDYKTFVASAFFLQNRADSFLAMGADERKDVFAKLLDLGTYERLEDEARARARTAESRRKEFAAQAERLGATTPAPEEIERELAAASAAAGEASSLLGSAEQVAKDRAGVLGELEKQAALIDAEVRALADLREREGIEVAGIESKKRELEECNALLARADEVSAALAEIGDLRTRDESARADRTRAGKLREQMSATEERIKSERASIERRCRDRDAVLTKLHKEIASLEPAAAELKGVDAALASTTDIDTALEKATTRLDEQRTLVASMRATLGTIDASLAETNEKIEMLKSAEATCPICGAALDVPHRREITKNLRTTEKKLAADRKELVVAGKRAAKDEKDLSEKCEALRGAQRERARLESKRSTLVVKIERLEAVRTEERDLALATKTDEALLESGEYAAAMQAELESLARSLHETYDAAAHQAIEKRLVELRDYEQLGGRLAEAGNRRVAVLADIHSGTTRVEEIGSAIRERSAALESSADVSSELEAARHALAEADGAVDRHRTVAAQTASSVSRFVERLEGARRIAAEISKARTDEIEAAAEHRRYDMLAKAFGPSGIPHRIISNARPELEAEANEILGQLTDYEMSLSFRMDRETKSGKVRETFDVLVSHDGGYRDFQMFSGGEAFRIAFAVRLGLSKLLVRRAGARLETLVIDEGFGTQDPVGRERLIEAIRIARREFAKVLVITHLDELKGMFDTQIRVTKDDTEGSRLEVVS